IGENSMQFQFVKNFHQIAIFFLFLFILLITACRFPQDSKGTLSRVKNDTLRVGITLNPPWVKGSRENPSGVEVKLVKNLAGQLNAHVQWVWGSQMSSMKALESGEVDLVIGGITAEMPHFKKTTLSKPYFKDRIVVGVPEAAIPFVSIKKQRVAYTRGSGYSKLIKKKGGIPVAFSQGEKIAMPVAISEAEVTGSGYSLTGIKLATEKHVFAIPSGENAWLVNIEEFFEKNRENIQKLIRENVR
ncbi:MAG: transporter substrate-binding domain-containing protein, partial [Calditrichia bacterium]